MDLLTGKKLKKINNDAYSYYKTKHYLSSIMNNKSVVIPAVVALVTGTLGYLYISSEKDPSTKVKKYKQIKNATYAFFGGASMVGFGKYLYERVRK